jgi:hypothetical protein
VSEDEDRHDRQRQQRGLRREQRLGRRRDPEERREQHDDRMEVVPEQVGHAANRTGRRLEAAEMPDRLIVDGEVVGAVEAPVSDDRADDVGRGESAGHDPQRERQAAFAVMPIGRGHAG